MSSGLKFKVPTGKLTRTMQRDHLDVLQNIEFFITKVFRECERVDDAAVREALLAALNHRDPIGGPAHDVWQSLCTAREMRRDVMENIWLDGIRVVLHSVKNHSECRLGETSYLGFVGQFVGYRS